MRGDCGAAQPPVFSAPPAARTAVLTSARRSILHKFSARPSSKNTQGRDRHELLRSAHRKPFPPCRSTASSRPVGVGHGRVDARLGLVSLRLPVFRLHVPLTYSLLADGPILAPQQTRYIALLGNILDGATRRASVTFYVARFGRLNEPQLGAIFIQWTWAHL